MTTKEAEMKKTIPNSPLVVAAIARLCYEANRAYAMSIGDPVVPAAWDDTTPNIRKSLIDGVRKNISGVVKTPAESHQAWLEFKTAEGWTYGPVRDDEKKVHPCMVPYSELSVEQKRKDAQFQELVKTTSALIRVFSGGEFDLGAE
jgi:hypothetical protein